MSYLAPIPSCHGQPCNSIPVTTVDDPTYLELIYAAWLIEKIAREEKFQYVFVGSIAARFQRGDSPNDFTVKTIEILLEHKLYDNVAMWNLIHRRRELTITARDQLVVRVGAYGSRGIIISCICLGTDGYPNRFIPPYNSGLHTREHIAQQLEPTFRMVPIGTPGRIFHVPVIRWRLGFHQRFLRLDLGTTDKTIHARNKSDIVEMKAFLEGAVNDGEPPFSRDVVGLLQRRLERVADYAKIKGHKFEGKHWENLRKMGFREPARQIQRSSSVAAYPVTSHAGPVYLLRGQDGTYRFLYVNP